MVAGGCYFDTIAAGMVYIAVAQGDMANSISFGQAPIPIGFKFYAVVIAAYYFEVFEQAAVHVGFVIPDTTGYVFYVGGGFYPRPFAVVTSDGEVTFVYPYFVARIVAAAQFNHIARRCFVNSTRYIAERAIECATTCIVVAIGRAIKGSSTEIEARPQKIECSE